jgi:7-carboxy-7-deazaguanine synthase
MRSLNLQPIEKVVHDSDKLEVVDVWITLQGEGPLAGTPAVFVRLAGCTLQCGGCDTDYTTGRQEVLVEDLIKQVRNQCRGGLVVITGGEPFRQPIGRFARKLFIAGYKVQVETNGTVYQEDFPFHLPEVNVVCSPKTTKIDWRMANCIRHWKYILHADKVDEVDGLPTSSLLIDQPPCRPVWNVTQPDSVFVQPYDDVDPEQNDRHIKAAVASCLRHGYRLSLQMHKQLGLK